MNTLALITLMVWPVIPLFWIPVHIFPDMFRKLKLVTYAMPLFTWLPVVYLIYECKDVLLHFKIDIHFMVSLAGFVLLVIGTGVHIWTGKLLSLWGLIGLPEVYERFEGKLVTTGAFALVRHPTYLAHTLMFSGVFLATGFISIAALTIIDLLTVNLIIIPYEERELLERFGEGYRSYMKHVPKIIPRFGKTIK